MTAKTVSMNETIAPRVNIAGTGISNITLPETIALFDEWIRTGQKKRVCVTPVNCVVWAHADQQLQHIYNEADLVLCDGVPLIWASRFLGSNVLRGRVTGLDLLPEFTAFCHRKGYSLFFLGGSEKTLGTATAKLQNDYPGIRLAGTYSPPYKAIFSEKDNHEMLQRINAARPDILWVSLTAPKQDLWIAQVFEQLDVKIAIGIGGALEVLAGDISRAPRWMQRNGLEWLYRFLKEPKRLFRRYFLEAPGIIPLLLKQKFSGSQKPKG
jgi:N-acetylglucosaminyldiphosphoundecaprenol N-acetyl-beta-D-mannosaminyltransferase